MRDELNPYQAPEAAEGLIERPKQPERRLERFATIGWPIALGLNLPIPLMFGAAMTGHAGRWGMFLGILVMLGLGYLFCYCLPDLSRRFVWVSGLMAVTQFLPLLQIIAGMIAITIANRLPFLSLNFPDDDGTPEQIQNELSGFAITVMVGLLLSLGVVSVALVSSLIRPPTKSRSDQR
jgi:hypothetical protein